MQAKKYNTNYKGCGVKTYVRGIRASIAFWDKCKQAADLEGTNTNCMILYCVEKYCDRVIKRKEVDNGGR